MQSMKGATSLLGSMNRQMNLPALQRIAMEFERENDIMDQRQEMMDDAIDDVTGLEDEEEGEEVVNQVLDEIGVDLNQAVCFPLNTLASSVSVTDQSRWVKHHRDYRKVLSRKIVWHRQSVAEKEQKTTTSRREWTSFDGDQNIGSGRSFYPQRGCWASDLPHIALTHGTLKYKALKPRSILGLQYLLST